MKPKIAIAAAALAVSCAPISDAELTGDAKQPAAFARMMAVKDGQLLPVGQAQMVEHSNGLKLMLSLDKFYLPDRGGPYGMHVHAVGRCDLPDFASAGPHWNPHGQQHGRDNPAGAHAGDLANLNPMIGQANSGGGAIAGMRLADLLDADGAALVIHEKADDYKTDPSGNSGKRIMCGVFERP